MTEPAGLALSGFDEGEIGDFVAELYRIFLAREPDPVGLAHYVARLQAGTPLTETIAVFADSDEHRKKQQARLLRDFLAHRSFAGAPAEANPVAIALGSSDFPEDYRPPGEAGRNYLHRLRSGFFHRYCNGPVVLDVGFSGYDNPERKAAFPHAIGVDLDYPGYDGIRLPFDDGTVDTVFASHCLEHILFDHAAIRDWYRVLKIGGFIVCMVPSQALYEKRRFLPSRFNADHKRMYTPASLAQSFETALEVNTYRVRHLAENDRGFNYGLGPEIHSDGSYEIEIVIEKITPPVWKLD